ncbi:MAG: DUF3579 domain-containing protein [Gallionellaceae bacterium]|nr:DUF3579 domain-containing protein [Gallionellaceae bacterium]MDD5365180.1 DUF3579 domain-containing protein [Gallionellaceae bacterium]
MTAASLAPHPPFSSPVDGTEPSTGSLFILGQTRAGQPFRPSDWVDRMAGLFASFGKDKKLRYSPWIRPATLDGTRGLWLEQGLRQRDPAAFAFVMAFADSHGLAVRPALGQQPSAGG